jgi:hypothetical protein
VIRVIFDKFFDDLLKIIAFLGLKLMIYSIVYLASTTTNDKAALVDYL